MGISQVFTPVDSENKSNFKQFYRFFSRADYTFFLLLFIVIFVIWNESTLHNNLTLFLYILRIFHRNKYIFFLFFSKLVINQIIPEDDAIYQCMAENSQGSILSRARLTVVMSEDRPSAPYNVHAETMSSSAILLAWERPLYNSDKVIAYSVHYMKAEGKPLEECLSLIPFALMDLFLVWMMLT